MFHKILKIYFSIIFLFLTFGLTFSQIHWVETSQSDFADGDIDQSLYISYRSYIEGIDGAVEWTPRFDFDLNGYPDLVSSDYNYGERDIRVWYMNAIGLDSSNYLTFYDAGGANDVADLNCDGYPELVQSGFGWNNVLIFWNNSGTFSDSDTSMLGPHSTGEGIYIADYDRDGYLDIAITGENDFRIYWGSSGGIHGWRSSADTVFNLEYGTHFNIESADIDDDGDLDLMAVYGRTTDGPLYIFRNQGARVFVVDSFFLSMGSDRRHGLSVGDIDNDGDIDIVSTGFWTSSATVANVLLNDGTGHFPDDIQIHPGPCHGGSSIYDFNVDGWLDILFFQGSPAGYLKIYENTGTPPYFSDASSYSVSPFPVDASGGMVIDVNNDGYVDIYADNMETQSYVFLGPDYSTYVLLPVNQDHHGMFRDPGNILDRTKTAFYESSIFDAGESICSGTVFWDAYDERDYFGGELPIPLGSEVIILARSGDTPSPDASWTEWDTLTDGEELPSSITGNRYYQYRAELWYENPAYLPWLEKIEFNFTPCSEDSTGLFANLITPPRDSIIACEDQQIIFYISPYSSSPESVRVLMIGDNHGYYDYFSHCSTGMGDFLVDTLESMGIYIDVVSPLIDVSTLLSGYDIVFLMYDIWDLFSIEEIDSFESFIRCGGSLLSIPGAPAGDAHEAGIHNDILSLVGISYITPRIESVDSIGVSGSHPVLDGINSITFYKPFPINCSDEQCIIHYGSNCIMASDTYYSGKILAYANEHFLSNGEGYYGSIRTGNVAADNCKLAKNIFDWLTESIETVCPLDTSSIVLTIDGIDYTMDSSELDYAEPYLTFTPPSTDFWTTGEHIFSLYIEDTCGNTFDSSYTAMFDFGPPEISIINYILRSELDSIEIVLSDTIAGLNPDTGYYIIDSTDTVYYSFSGSSGTLSICPDTGWSAGGHSVCVIACDDPDLCGPNCSDTCFTIIFLANLSAEIVCPPESAIVACEDQPIIFKIYYDSLCLPLDADSTMLIIDSVDTYTLDSTQLYFDSADSLLHFEPGPGYWNSGWHFFWMHLQDDCGNVFDSLYSAIFDVDPPTAYMLDPPVGEPMDTSILYTYEPVYIYDLEHPISIRLDDNIAGVLPESTVFIVRGQTIPFLNST